MAQGFYELLGVEPTAPPETLRDAYQRRLADLVRRVRVAQQQGADVTLLEHQERAVREAMDVVGDPARRRSYDAYLQVASQGALPQGAGELWNTARGGLVEPIAGVALATVRALTKLEVGDPLPAPPPGYSAQQTWAVEHREPTGDAGPAPASTVPPAAGTDTTPHDDIEIAPIPGNLTPSLSPAVPPPPSPDSLRLDFPLPSPQMDLNGNGGLDTLWGSAPAPAPVPERRGLLGKLAALTKGASTPMVSTEPTTEPAGPLPADPIDRLRHQHGVSGGFLRGVRTLRGLSLDELSRSTRISARYLSALEEDAFDRLPSATFVRGYLRQVTAVLDLEGEGIVDDYMATYRQHRG